MTMSDCVHLCASNGSHDANRFWRIILSHTHIVAAVATLIHHIQIQNTYTHMVLPYAPCLASICIPERHIAGFVATRNPETDTPTSASLERFKAHIGQLFGWYGSANGLHQDKARNRKKPPIFGFPHGRLISGGKGQLRSATLVITKGTVVVDCHYLGNPPSQGWHSTDG